MQHFKHYIPGILSFLLVNANAQTVIPVKHFNNIIISPHIRATFTEGSEVSVTVQNIEVDRNKLHVEVNGKTLRVYLEGAKDIEKNKTEYRDGYKEKHSLYNGTVVIVSITYKTLNELSVRGEEKQVCESALKGDKFRLKIYGESDVILNEVNLAELETTIYGESNLKIVSGFIKFQKYTAYGEGKINSLDINSNNGVITAYGEADFKMNISDEIRITAFGEANLHYTGNPVINKGLHIGELHIEKLNKDL